MRYYVEYRHSDYGDSYVCLRTEDKFIARLYDNVSKEDIKALKAALAQVAELAEEKQRGAAEECEAIDKIAGELETAFANTASEKTEPIDVAYWDGKVIGVQAVRDAIRIRRRAEEEFK